MIFICGEALQRIAIAAQTLFQIGLLGNGKHDHIPLAVQFLGQPLASNLAGMIVVGADEEKPLAGGRVRVHRDYRNAGGDGAIDIVLHHGRVGHRDQDPAGFALHRLLQRFLLSLGIVGVRTRELGTHLELLGRLKQTGRAGLPVRNFDVG